MKVHITPAFKLIFCDATEKLFPAGYLETSFYPLDLTRFPYNAETQRFLGKDVYAKSLLGGHVVSFSKKAPKNQVEESFLEQDFLPQSPTQESLLKSVVLLKQTHSTQGFCVTNDNLVSLTTTPRHEGDFLCTQLSGVGIGVLTADCLPIALYDPINNAAAIVHAGWRGTVGGIGAQTLQSMHDSFGTSPEDVQVFFGPCAKPCCYQVGEDFVQNLLSFTWADKVIERRENGLFFDLSLCNSLLLQEVGINPASISYTYNECTICNNSFCSYRRDAATSCRQLSLIMLC